MDLRKEIDKKTYNELRKSIKLRDLSKDMNLSFDKATKLQREQDEAFKKWSFFKELKKAINEVEK